MLLKWKTILTNWINCYFNESDDKEQSVTLESLLGIISHLRENHNFDESKSSLFEAHTVEEFIQEKYPQFGFDNETVEANSDDDMYMVASLLLFFVCVNSKDIDIKNAMCSNLSANDQEVILRFSKCLMKCSPITCKDVQTAITHACSPSAVDAGSARQVVSETPPALRSLHGEVRRLQAALDAERFDRNYLQDELARTNLTVEKLTKDREQYKLDIVNLKAKISLCCGQEAEAKAGDKAAEGTTKLMKELQQMEEKLVETQGLLEDANYERDTYKAKVNELKQERDKWLSLSQQETSRASQLSEQLEGERRYVQSLKELVEELRQHRQLNRLDSSQLECDDPDASVQSLNHNSSICSEACANVVEVQLAEERAKITLLKQQIQTLQEQLNDLSHRSETEILSLNKIVSEKDSEIFDLKHRINEEIEARHKLAVHYSDENSKLNNEINELEQRLKDNNNQSRLVIEMKMQEIQTLQEEKLSLLQSLTDETTKLEGIIENVKSELATEKNSKLKLRDDYENHIMKLNEKVLNRNNELVELQNNVFAKSEHIEELNLELRKERQTRETFVEQCHSELKLVNERKADVENALKQKCDENESLMDRLNNNYTYTEELSKELNQLKTSNSQLIENCNSLEETKALLINEIQIRDNRLDEQCKKIENCINVSSEERNNYKKHVEAYETRNTELAETIEKTRAEMLRQQDSYKTVLESRARDIQTLQRESQSLQDELIDVKHQLDLKVHSLNEKLLDSEKLTEKLKQSYECQIENLNLMVNKVKNYLKDKTSELDTAKKDKERLQEVIDSNNEVIKCLEEEVKSHRSNQEKFISEFETERLILKNMITVTESIMKDQKLSSDEVIANHIKDNETLKEELKDLHNKLELTEANIHEKEDISKTLIRELTVLRNEKEKLDIDYEAQKKHFNTEILKLNEELTMKVSRLELVELQHKELTDVLQKRNNDLLLLEVNKKELTNETKKLKEQNESLICELTNMELQNKDLKHTLLTLKETITQLEENNNDSIKDNNTLKNEVDFKLSQIKMLELKNEELEGLLQICKRDIEMVEENNNEMKIKKDLQESELTNKVCNISKELTQQITVVKILQNELDDKNKQNMEIEEKLLRLASELSSVSLHNETIKSERDNYISKVKELESQFNTDTMTLNNQIAELNAEKSKLLHIVEEKKLVIKSLEDEVISEKRKQEKILRDFESQKKLLMRKIAVSRSVIMKQKENYSKTLSDHAKICTILKKEIKTLKKSAEKCRQKESYITTLESKAKDVQILQQENQSLLDELNDVKHQLDLKVHSLNEKLLDNEKLTDKLKQSYESQIENLNVMVNKVTNYLKDKTSELDTARKDKERLQEIIDSNNEDIKRLKDEVKSQKSNQEKFINEFETERLGLKNMITVTESIMKDQELSLNEVIKKHDKENETLKEELKDLNHKLELTEANVQEKDDISKSLKQELTVLRNEKEKLNIDFEAQKQHFSTEIVKLNEELNMKVSQLKLLESQHKELTDVLQKCGDDRALLEENKNDLIKEIKKMKEQNESLLCGLTNLELKNKELENNFQKSRNIITQLEENTNALKKDVDFKLSQIKMLELKNQEIEGLLQICKNDLLIMEESNNEIKMKKDLQETEFTNKVCNISKELAEQITVNKILVNELEDKNNQNKELKENLLMSTSELPDYETKAAKQLEEKNKEIAILEEDIKTLRCKIDVYEKELKGKDSNIKDKEELIYHIKQELIGEKTAKEKLQIELETNVAMVSELKQKMDDSNSKEVLRALRNEEWVRAIGQKEIYAVAGSERTGSSQGYKHSSPLEKHYREFHHQVDNTTSDLTHSSMESIKTISDLEKIIHDKNRTITTLQSDITYLKSLVADSENKLLDVTKELEVSKENCQQLSNQLKKIVHQKNEEIAELKRQLSKMSVTENRASQIIKVSAKYQAIILKRIAEIKTTTVLKELTNFGNSSNGENDLRRSLNAGTVTMEDLENFLETTDKHLRRCSDKQVALQKERDRLAEVNRINESENINLKKFLTELSVSFKTFSNVKELYAQKLSRVVSVQRTVRREILNLDSQINDATMCKLERGYAAVMQDLSECVMNLERWVERCIGRMISPEKIKQAFTSDDERASFATATFQNTSLEVQLDELENSFKKLLEEVVRAQKGEGVRDAQSATVMEVRAEYEDKLNRMKTKMKQLYQEQILIYKEKQREEMSSMERELVKTREKLAMSSKAYEDHIKSLTMELWRVGEKFLFKKDELEWMQKKQRSGSLMSLQHVHSSGLVPPQEETSRVSDAHSLRSLQVNNNPNPSKREARTLHMSDEEGEVFDNRWLRELAATPGRAPPSPPARLSELRWRNSLCPPHLKSSYPAETQFAPALDEEDIKCMGAASLGGRNQRKEVGITAYKKPGPPTPSKNAGRLSATDSELRESLRPEPELPPRKTSTPSRLRALFRSSKNETTEGTPRSRRLSIFRKKQ